MKKFQKLLPYIIILPKKHCTNNYRVIDTTISPLIIIYKYKNKNDLGRSANIFNLKMRASYLLALNVLKIKTLKLQDHLEYMSKQKKLIHQKLDLLKIR